MKIVIIQGSSRSDGNTATIVRYLQKELSADVIDLKSHVIGHYDYSHSNQDDDFLPLMRKIVTYDLIIFATPVYWYAMSGMMKTFLDRITDCLKIEKETGRKLRGKSMAAISCGSEAEEIEGFFVPFRLSADYLGMRYLGDVHTWIDDSLEKEVLERLQKIILVIKNKI